MNKIQFEDNNNKPKSKFKANIGFYLTLFICIAAVAFAVWTTYNSVTDYMKPSKEIDNSTVSEKSVEKNVSDLPYSTSSEESQNEENSSVNSENSDNSNTSKPTSENENKNNSTLSQEDKNINVIAPILGGIIKNYSGENPVYSNTFKDWRIHNGTDYEGEKGENITSVSDGTVKEIYNDNMMGYSMKIEDSKGYIYIYNGLDENVMLKVGDKVTKGDIIGQIGVIPSEISDKSHIHLSIMKDGKFIDPSSLV